MPERKPHKHTVDRERRRSATPNFRLKLYGTLHIKDIDGFLLESKDKFHNLYKLPCPYKSERKNFKILYTLGKGGYGTVVLVQSKSRDIYAMKVLKKSLIVEKNQLQHVFNEKRILQSIDHPFTIRMEFFAKDNSYLYFIIPFMSGGDMLFHLFKAGSFDEDLSRFYAAQVVLAFQYLHGLRLVYRDLKPENIMLDQFGYIKLTDLGFTKRVLHRTYTLCGTPAYFSPEAILGYGYRTSVDWWAFGVLLFEMNSGYEPFHSKKRMHMMVKIVKCKYSFPSGFSPALRDLLEKLLELDVSKRLGNLKNEAIDVKNHEWFGTINWTKLFNRRLVAPFVPCSSDVLQNFPTKKHRPKFPIASINEFEEEFKDF